MKKCLILLLLFWCSHRLGAQNFEFMLGVRNLGYQHAFTKNAGKESRFGITHIASVLVPLKLTEGGGKSANEVMNQGYLRFRINKFLSINAGGFYANSNGLRPSVALGYIFTGPQLLMLMQPRVDITKSPSFELFGLVEWRPILSKHLLGYTRLQFMSNHGNSSHNRSYQQLRVGLEVRSVQFGIGFQADEYGRNFSTRYNTGLFIRRQF